MVQTIQGTDREKGRKPFSEEILNAVGMGVYLVQSDVFVYVNPLLERISGYNSRFLLGRDPLHFVHPEDRDEIRHQAVAQLKGLTDAPYEYRFIKSDGHTVWIMERVSSIDYDGKRATLGSFMDITEYKRTEAYSGTGFLGHGFRVKRSDQGG